MTFTTTGAPLDGDTVLPLADAKAHLRVLNGDEDALIAALRDAAIDWVERYCAISLSARAFTYSGDGFPTRFRLPYAPATDVTAISTFDTSGAAVALDPADWQFRAGHLYPAIGSSWPTVLNGAGSVTVTFTAGYASAADIPPAILSAVKLLTGHLFKQREATISGQVVTEVPFGVTALLAAFRTPVIG